MAAGITAIALAILSFAGQQYFSNRMKIEKSEETRRIQIQSNYQLYSELMSRREESESALRKDMFTAILGAQLIETDVSKYSLSDRLLQLEMLALNFSESMHLGPLFEELERKISVSDSTKEAKKKCRDRLQSVARKVLRRQIEFLDDVGKSFDIQVILNKAGEIEKI